MQLVESATIRSADENDIYETLSALNEELRRRVDTDDGLAATVRALYPTAAPDGVLLADGTTVPVGRHAADDTAREAWLLTCDDVANLAAIDGAIIDDFEYGWMVRFDQANRSAVDGMVVTNAAENSLAVEAPPSAPVD